MSIQAFGKIIKQRRIALQLTQYDLAQLAKVNMNTLSKIERGEANAGIEVIEKIADVLGLELKLEVKKITF